MLGRNISKLAIEDTIMKMSIFIYTNIKIFCIKNSQKTTKSTVDEFSSLTKHVLMNENGEKQYIYCGTIS